MIPRYSNVLSRRTFECFGNALFRKVVVVDQQLAVVGGLDLCIGRYDDWQHRITDSRAVTWQHDQYQLDHRGHQGGYESSRDQEIQVASGGSKML